MRVLIVDDEPLARTALERAFRGRNDIETLDSAKDAIQALEMMQEDSTMCCLSISGCRDSLELNSLIV